MISVLPELARREVYVLTVTWLHPLDSGEDKKVAGVFATREAAIAAGEAYKAGRNYQYQYSVSEEIVK